MRPVVGVTSIPRQARNVLGELPHETVPELYLDAVRAGGGVPVVLPSHGPPAPELCHRVDALVLTGGGDVEPARYGSAGAAEGVDEVRDAAEAALLSTAVELDLPVLAICRGMQLLNVVLGGTLVAELRDAGGRTEHWDVAHWSSSTHPVGVVQGSLLHGIGGARFLVNSVHHQALDRLADGLVPVARADDGLVEAVELTRRSFVLGVQWHPECLEEPPHPQLFAALVAAATTRGPERMLHATRP